jgi:hypothetical protein
MIYPTHLAPSTLFHELQQGARKVPLHLISTDQNTNI